MSEQGKPTAEREEAMLKRFEELAMDFCTRSDKPFIEDDFNTAGDELQSLVASIRKERL